MSEKIQFCKGGGCTAKLGPGILERVLERLPKVDNINMNDITPNFVQHLEEPARSIITSSYSDALVPLFLYIVPLLLVGAVIMALLKENPLATNVNHTGHPSDDDL